eukprot:Sspe_Gene.110175::Locus_90553_Transcript_3_4_Confidence_0.625_Length_464::g.110175::m.110175
MRRADVDLTHAGYMALMDSCCYAGEVEACEKYLAEWCEKKGSKGATTGHFTHLLKAYRECGDLDGVQTVLARWEASGVPHDAVSYSVTLGCLAGDPNVNVATI